MISVPRAEACDSWVFFCGADGYSR